MCFLLWAEYKWVWVKTTQHTWNPEMATPTNHWWVFVKTTQDPRERVLSLDEEKKSGKQNIFNFLMNSLSLQIKRTWRWKKGIEFRFFFCLPPALLSLKWAELCLVSKLGRDDSVSPRLKSLTVILQPFKFAAEQNYYYFCFRLYLQITKKKETSPTTLSFFSP